jgi:hypothetical protein
MRNQQKLGQVQRIPPVHDGAEQAATREQNQRAIVFQRDQRVEETARDVLRIGSSARNADHQEQAAERNGAGDEKRCQWQVSGNHDAQHRPRCVPDVGQGVAERKHFRTLPDRQVLADYGFGADQKERRSGFGDHQRQGRQVNIVSKRQQRKSDSA